LDIVRLQ